MSGRKPYVPEEMRDAQSDPRFMGGMPIRPAGSRAKQSRSYQRRIAHQRGEPIPQFDLPKDKP